MNRYSVNGSLTAMEGKRDELLGYLLKAAEEMEQVPDCYCYIVGVDPEDQNKVYVFEVWESAQAHLASLELEVFKELIRQAKPIIVGMDSYPSLSIRGGKAQF